MTSTSAPALRVYRVPDFHKKGALVRDLGALLIRADLSEADEAVLFDEAISRLLGRG